MENTQEIIQTLAEEIMRAVTQAVSQSLAQSIAQAIAESNAQSSMRILKFKDLKEVLPFGEHKIRRLVALNELPVVTVGRDCLTTTKIINEWIEKHVGEELFY